MPKDLPEFKDGRTLSVEPPVLDDKSAVDKEISEAAELIGQRKHHYRTALMDAMEEREGRRPSFFKSFSSYGAPIVQRESLDAIATKYPLTHGFFSEGHKVMTREGKELMLLRGRDYYFFHREFRSGISEDTLTTYKRIVSDFDRINHILEVEYADENEMISLPLAEKMYFLSLLDYRKNLALNVLNCVIFLRGATAEVLMGETEGTTKSLTHFTKEKAALEAHMTTQVEQISPELIQRMIDLTQSCVDDYYAAFLGEASGIRRFEPGELTEATQIVTSTLESIRDSLGRHNRKHERIAQKKILRGDRESDNPLHIMLQAYLQNKADSNEGCKPDYIVPILYGGIELAFAYKSIHKIVNPEDEDEANVLPLVLSQYNVGNFSSVGRASQYFPSGLPDLTDKTVLILDDNVLSGLTMDKAIKLFVKAGARVRASATELDLENQKDYVVLSLLDMLQPSAANVLDRSEETITKSTSSVAAISAKMGLYDLLRKQP